MTPRRKLLNLLAIAAIVPCIGCDASAITGGRTIRSLRVTNYLVMSVDIEVDGVSQGVVDAGATRTFNLAESATDLHYTTHPFRYTSGNPVPNELPGASRTIDAGKDDVFWDITNEFAGGVFFFYFRITNSTGSPISVGVAANGLNQCLSLLPPQSSGLFGYYRVTVTSEVRYYASANCTGGYRFWNSSQIAGFAPQTGALDLVANTLP